MAGTIVGPHASPHCTELCGKVCASGAPTARLRLGDPRAVDRVARSVWSVRSVILLFPFGALLSRAGPLP
jgi:hypothetical protein